MTDELPEWTVPAFKWINKKRKRNMESTVRKLTMESIVHTTYEKNMEWKLKYEFAEARINCFT